MKINTDGWNKPNNEQGRLLANAMQLIGISCLVAAVTVFLEEISLFYIDSKFIIAFLLVLSIALQLPMISYKKWVKECKSKQDLSKMTN